MKRDINTIFKNAFDEISEAPTLEVEAPAADDESTIFSELSVLKTALEDVFVANNMVDRNAVAYAHDIAARALIRLTSKLRTVVS